MHVALCTCEQASQHADQFGTLKQSAEELRDVVADELVDGAHQHVHAAAGVDLACGGARAVSRACEWGERVVDESRPVVRWDTSTRSIDRLIYQSIDPLIDGSTNRLIDRSINRSVNRSIGQSINRPIGQSVNRLIDRSSDYM